MRVFAYLIAGLTVLFTEQPSVGEPFPPTTQEFVQVDENNLLLGGLPDKPSTGFATKAQINSFFAKLQAEKVEYRYIVGSCEDRAHFVTMLARKEGLPVSKVWAIAPARTTLLSRQLILVKDPLNLSPKVAWGHHVAPVILVENGTAEPDAMVIDQSISVDGPIKLRDWMAALAAPWATYLATGPNDYLFNSLNGLTVYDNGSGSASPSNIALPSWMPNILTGDFQKYSPQSRQYIENEVAAGMAKNDLALAIYEERLQVSSSDRPALKQIIKTEAAMDSLVLSVGNVSSVSSAGVQSARTFYGTRKTHWQDRLTKLQ